jgi:hypothetical protein
MKIMFLLFHVGEFNITNEYEDEGKLSKKYQFNKENDCQVYSIYQYDEIRILSKNLCMHKTIT